METATRTERTGTVSRYADGSRNAIALVNLIAHERWDDIDVYVADMSVAELAVTTLAACSVVHAFGCATIQMTGRDVNDDEIQRWLTHWAAHVNDLDTGDGDG